MAEWPTHPHTDACGFDRDASLNENQYVCCCGWRSEDKINAAGPETSVSVDASQAERKPAPAAPLTLTREQIEALEGLYRALESHSEPQAHDTEQHSVNVVPDEERSTGKNHADAPDVTGAPARSEPESPHDLVTWVDEQCKASGYEIWWVHDGKMFFQRSSNIEGKIQVLGPLRLDWLIATAAQSTESPPTQDTARPIVELDEAPVSGGNTPGSEPPSALPASDGEPIWEQLARIGADMPAPADGDLTALVERLHKLRDSFAGTYSIRLLVGEAASTIERLVRDDYETTAMLGAAIKRAEANERDAALFRTLCETHPGELCFRGETYRTEDEFRAAIADAMKART